MLVLAAALAALLLVAAPASASTQTFTNPASIAFPTAGPSSPYPSSVSVSGMPGPITDVNVTLHRFGHPYGPSAVDVLLVSPSGKGVIVMSDPACNLSVDFEDFTWIFDQQAAAPMTTPCSGFVYQPTNFDNGSADVFPFAPPDAYGANLNRFNNQNANGTWSLYVVNNSDQGGDIEGGWSLTITTGQADTVVPGAGTFGPANPYPSSRTVSGVTGVITDVNVKIDGIWHPRPDDLDLLLVGPRGQKVVLMSDACGSFENSAFGWTWDDDMSLPMPDGGPCGLSVYRPADYEPGDVWPAPAPPGPYAGALSAFDLTDPDGDWRLFVADDSSDKVGFFTHRFELGIATRPKAEVAFTENAVQVSEGSRRALKLARSGAAAFGAGAVTVTSLPISATSGRDFTPVSTVVEFAAGEKEKTVAVEALADADREPDEIFVVAIGSPTGDAATGTPSSVAVTVPGPASTAHAGADSGVGGASPGFGSKTLVTLALAAVHVGPRGPVKVRVANANGFTVAGELATQSGRVQLRRRPFTVAAHAKKNIKLDLPKTLRKLLKRKHRLSLRLSAKVTDPAGHRRTVTRTVKPKLRLRT